MDAVTLDGVLAELRPALVGRHLARVRVAGPHAVAFEIAGGRDAWLWLETGREIAGLYLMGRAEVLALQDFAGVSRPPRAGPARPSSTCAST